jgi:hypothetical protein
MLRNKEGALELSIGTIESDCYDKLGSRVEDFMVEEPRRWRDFDQIDDSAGFALVGIQVPEGTGVCTQKVLVDLKTQDSNGIVAGDFFLIEVEKPGIF